MSSTSAVLSRAPRVRLAPRSAHNDADDATFLSAGYGLTPDDWQEDILEDWLGRRANGRWAAATCALAVPRQNGKNGIIEMRELFGMVALGERFLHTAHEVKTARKAFLRIASFFEDKRNYPELAALVKDIRKTNGQEAVLLTNGGGVEFIARSSGSGRGFTVDVLVCDEAQDLTDDELAALLPTISAAPLGNPQVILTGTPPDPEKAHLAKGEVFRRVRSDGENGRDKRLAWTDFGVPDGTLPDVDDREMWAKVNPALATRLNVAEVERERGLMSPETFARERLGWWGDPAGSTADTLPNWPECAAPGIEVYPKALGLAVSFDRSSSSLAAVGVLDDDMPALGAVDRRPGTAWVADEAKRIQDAYGCDIVIDKLGPAATFIPVLEDMGVRVTAVDTKGACDACANLFDKVDAGQVVHADHPALNDAVRIATKRSVGDGRWLWGRRSSRGDVSMLEAATLALWSVRESVYEARDLVTV